MAETPRGRFCWYELMTSDPEAAQDFYRTVVGWTTQRWDGGETPYTMWMNGEAPVGGVMALPPGAGDTPPHWIAYVSTPDTDATIAEAKDAGATVVWGPMDIPMVGRVAGLADSAGGAMFAVHQPAGDTPGHDGPAQVGEFSWHELASDDPDAAWAFYSSLFDWEKTDAMDMGEMGMYQMFGRGAHPIGAIFGRPPDMPMACWMLYARVGDLDGAVERVKGNGGRVQAGPMEVPGGDHIAVCVDPQGAYFALHHASTEG